MGQTTPIAEGADAPLGEGLATKVDFHDGLMTVGRFQDCDPILENAKARHREGFHGSSDFKHAARIPNVIIEKYCNDNKIEFSEFMQNPAHIKRVLNDPSLSAFRIWPGRV